MTTTDFLNAGNVRKFQPGDSWPDPDMTIINAGARDAPDLPVDLFSPLGAGNGAARCIIEEARQRSCPPDYVAGGLLATAAALIGNSRVVSPWTGWREPIALNVGLVGSPSAMKSPAMDIVLDPLKEHERAAEDDYRRILREHETKALEAKLAHEAWQARVTEAAEQGQPAPEMPENAETPERPGCLRLTATDATVPAMADVCMASPKGVLMQRDELAGWLENLGQQGCRGDRAFYVESYGARAYSIDRKKNGRRFTIPRLLISIMGGIQPDKLATALLHGDDDGLAARFLYFWPKPTPFVRPPDLNLNTGLNRAIAQLNGLQMCDLGDGELAPVELPLTEGAQDLFSKWCSDIVQRGNDASGLIAGFLGKGRGGVLRLAAVFEHLDWAFDLSASCPSQISADCVGRAIVLYDEYLIAMAERAFGDAARPPAERAAAVLAKEILKRQAGIEAATGLVSVRDVQRRWRPPGLNEALKIKGAFTVLEDVDWVRDVSSRAGGTPGRKKTEFLVNPKVWEAAP